ncbi:MAG: helicase-related protein [Verrucomicrobiota bacterium]
MPIPDSKKIVPGQRWVSDTEPELGLGIVLKSEYGRAELFFPAANEHRQYAMESAPLRRVRFREGDHIQTHDGEDFVVTGVMQDAGLLSYETEKREVAEAELSDLISFSKPEDRLMGGQVDDLRTFELRVEALHRQAEIRKSPVRGFVGGRVDLIPHQMVIANEVASRLAPRVLLADEVGLGKTIEACLILHRLHLTGRAERVLILVPEPLIHQWFVELLRRFNLLFSLFDEERCASIEANDPDANPFLDSQLVLCGIEFLTGDADRAAQVLEAGWDLLVVDEAHHLEWSPEGASESYELVEALAAQCAGLLLLTATPQQLGRSGHFARLRLLDPDRYADLDEFLEEAEHYEEVADAVDRLQRGKAMNAADEKLFASKSARIRKQSEALAKGDEGARGALVSELVDEFGTGRVMFRNTRADMTGFPVREAKLAELTVGEGEEELAVKVKWLTGLLKELGEEKVLLICRTREMAEELSEALLSEMNVNCALFHEELTLVQRDRNAAYFSEADGARILICSEIGSEGRNFQFAHHLVLFDLPDDPEVLEQRIGRLDRIGQTATIRVHVPYVSGTESEVLATWYHEGLGAFEKSLHGAALIVSEVGEELGVLREEFDAGKLAKLVTATKECHERVSEKLKRGHDRLLQLNSSRPEVAREMLRRIRIADEDHDFEDFMLRLIDHFGMDVEDLEDRAYYLQRGNLITDALPALPDEGLSVTFDRARALSREDLGFMTWDHPMVRGAIDTLLGAEWGNTAFGVWEAGEAKDTILMEVYVVAECVAPAALHADRFLPATPIRIVVDHGGGDRSEDEELAEAKLFQGEWGPVLNKPAVKQKLIPRMLRAVNKVANERLKGIVAEAAKAMEGQLQGEIDRLVDLKEINDHVGPEEIAALEAQKAALGEAIAGARVRVDAVRMIWKVRG